MQSFVEPDRKQSMKKLVTNIHFDRRQALKALEKDDLKEFDKSIHNIAYSITKITILRDKL